MDKHTVATLSRPFFSIKNDWTVEILDHSYFHAKIDKRLFILLIAFQTDMEYWEASQIATTHSLHTLPPKACSYPLESIKSNLAAYQANFSEVNPNEEDFLFVESLVTEDDRSFSSDEEKFIYICETLQSMMESDALTKNQKKALMMMLNKRICDY